ncbi:HAD family hydrolase [Nesterenkonia halotolerans]|uniref:HAD family hydrolase n=1 Tax=Nesterenkonia halotolerans TaxID=225325 RepID=UPI003EE7D624
MDIRAWRTLVFDCDGVLLNSNRVKTEAFYLAALPYGEEAAQRLVDYHVRNGGISRYKKFSLFLDEMVSDFDGPGLEELVASYADQVKKGLLNCEVAAGLGELRETTRDARWLIVSGGDQAELREVFAIRELSHLFDGEIFGSPDTKDEILARELAAGNVERPGLFLGDSTYDYRAATSAGLDFVFVSDWTEVPGWAEWCDTNDLISIPNLASLLN